MELFCPCPSTDFCLPSNALSLVGRPNPPSKTQALLTPRPVLLTNMESLEGLWSKLSLLDEEEFGIACPTKAEPDSYTLAAKFLTKRVVNVESVARTFRPLWRSEKDVQIKDMGDNILFFHFEDECDLGTVLEHEPWTYDKHLVVFEKVTANVPISSLAFQFTTFWIQIHELPVQCLNQQTRDAIGTSLGTPLLMTNTESEGGKGNYLRVRV